MFKTNDNYSRQENFVLDLLKGKKNGHYVELGAFHSKECSNTYHLESDYGWSGVSFEIMPERLDEFNSNRVNPCYGDALTFNYIDYFEKNNFPKQIDFLQVDIDNGGNEYNTRYAGIRGLISVPLNIYRFNIITFEHDTNMYFKNSTIRDIEREILDSLGYSLVVRDVHEDWWVDSTIFHIDEYRKYLSKEYQMDLMAYYQ